MLPGICVFADGCQFPHDRLPVTSIFVGGFPHYSVVPWIHGTCRKMQNTRLCRAPYHIHICRWFANYPVVPVLHGICVFADGCQLPDDAGLPVISIVTSLFAGGLPTTRGAGVLWHLQKDANYPMMEGSLSSLYFQAVCQLPGGSGVPWCAADFSLLNLPKGKSLGRSKPATNS